MVSVIIPAYNAAGTIRRAIESVLVQTVPPLETIVIDDGSEDGTAQLAESYGDRVRVIRQRNAGPAAARNKGATMATGEWLAFLDSDDVWLPPKLERQLPYTTSPRVGLVHCYTSHCHPVDPVNLRSLWRRNQIVVSGVLLRRLAFDQIGPFDEDPRLVGVEDYNLWLRVAARWHISTVPEELLLYLPGHNSLSHQNKRFALAQLENVEKIGQQLKLEPHIVAKKRIEILDESGLTAIYYRDQHVARLLLGRAFREAPSVRRATLWIAALLPRCLLDIGRWIVRLPSTT